MNEKNLVRHLSGLKSVAPRADWIRQNREVLSYQIFNGQESAAIKLGFFSRVGIVANRLLQPTPIAALIALFFMVSGVVGLNASKHTTDPANVLYAAKIIAERATVATTFDEKGKAKLAVEHAQNRANELNSFSQTSNPNDPRLQELTDNFKKEIASARERLSKLDEEAAKQAAIDAQTSVKPKLNLNSKASIKQKTDEVATTDEGVVSADSGKDEKGIQIFIPASKVLEEAEKLFNEKNYNEAASKLGEIEIK
ncbi:MAG TPA: DUF5667 domain-containing protein [bacterium]|jgi:hypothetical protein|nr:DUF5667 domain-containing protein [bacterium]